MKRRSKSGCRSMSHPKRRHRSVPLCKQYCKRFDGWPLPVVISDQRFVPQCWNLKARQMFGDSQWDSIRERIAHMAVYITPTSKDRPIMERLMSGSLDPWHEEEMILQDGRRMYCRWSSIPLRDKKGMLIGAISVAQDMTEHRRLEEKRQESERHFRMLADNAPVMIWMSGPDSEASYFNKPWLDFRGHTMEQEMAKNGWEEGIYPSDLERCVEIYQSAFVAQQTYKMEYRLRRYDGQYRWVFENGIPLYDHEGNFAGFIGSCIDITDQRQMMQDLENSYALLRGTLDSTADGILVVDGKGKMVIFNNRFVEMWRLPREILTARDDNRALAFVKDQLKDPESFMARVNDMYTHMEEVQFDNIEFKDGRVYERYTIPCVIKGRIIGRVWSFRDITARCNGTHTVERATGLPSAEVSPVFQVH